MLGILRFVRLWFLVSVPVGVLVGKLLKANRRSSLPVRERRR